MVELVRSVVDGDWRSTPLPLDEAREDAPAGRAHLSGAAVFA
jgi:hypothetical protein